MIPRYVAIGWDGQPAVPEAGQHALARTGPAQRLSHFGHIIWNLRSKSVLTGRLDMPI
jgi:hypothetical protein